MSTLNRHGRHPKKTQGAGGDSKSGGGDSETGGGDSKGGRGPRGAFQRFFFFVHHIFVWCGFLKSVLKTQNEIKKGVPFLLCTTIFPVHRFFCLVATGGAPPPLAAAPVHGLSCRRSKSFFFAGEPFGAVL